MLDNKVRLDDEMAKHWFGLPLHLRTRWWAETEYGKKPPSDELKEAVRLAIEEKNRAG